MEVDRNDLEVLNRDQCLALLASVPVARIAVSVDALPAVFPVNFACDGDDVVIRTSVGTKLDAALAHAVVAVEADAFDPVGHVGWSVLIQGTARVLTMPGEVARARALPLRPWTNDGIDRFVAISTDLVSGRRIRAGCVEPVAPVSRARAARPT